MTLSPKKTPRQKQRQSNSARKQQLQKIARDARRSGNQARKFDFQTALSEYRELQSLTKENQENHRKENTAASTATIVIDDDSELEDGEIVDDDSHISLMRESRKAIQKARSITEMNIPSTSSSEVKPLFYEDKNLDELKNAKVPLYNTVTDANGSQNSSSEVICLSDTLADDSVIFVKTPVNALRRPSFLSTPVINKLFGISDPKIQNEDQSPTKDTSPRKLKRVQRTRAYMAKKKLMRFTLTQDNLNQISIPPASLNLPSTSKAAAASKTNKVQLTKTATVTKTYAEVVAPPPPTISSDVAVPQDRKSPPPLAQTKEKRIILVDGSNVAFGYTESKMGRLRRKDDKDFSAEGLNIAINHFAKLGFQVKAVIPEFRVCRERSSNQELMLKMKDSGSLLLTAAKSYDDLMLLQSAKKLNAAIVSNDFFRKFI